MNFSCDNYIRHNRMQVGSSWLVIWVVTCQRYVDGTADLEIFMHLYCCTRDKTGLNSSMQGSVRRFWASQSALADRARVRARQASGIHSPYPNGLKGSRTLPPHRRSAHYGPLLDLRRAQYGLFCSTSTNIGSVCAYFQPCVVRLSRSGPIERCVVLCCSPSFLMEI